MILSELARAGGEMSRVKLRRFAQAVDIVDFDSVLDELNKNKLTISLYSFIKLNKNIKLINKLNKLNKLNNISLYNELTSKSAKMANVDYMAVVNGTTKRPNKRQKVTKQLSRDHAARYWEELLNSAGSADDRD